MSDWNLPDRRLPLSFQVFPPKTNGGMRELCGPGGILEQLYTLKPEYISCTYAPGGIDVGKNLEVMDKILRDGAAAGMTHFTCTGNTREGVLSQLKTYRDRNVDRLLVFRGREKSQRNGTDSFGSSEALIRFIRQNFGDSFRIAVAGTPESGADGGSLDAEMEAMQRKCDCGAERIVTRLCWDADAFCRWLEALRGANVWLPVHVGVLPVVDQADILSQTLAGRGGNVPRELASLIEQNWIYPNPFVKDPFDANAEGKKAAFKAAGIDYTLRQISHYGSCGVDGIHLHTGNRFADVARIARDAGLADLV